MVTVVASPRGSANGDARRALADADAKHLDGDVRGAARETRGLEGEGERRRATRRSGRGGRGGRDAHRREGPARPRAGRRARRGRSTGRSPRGSARRGRCRSAREIRGEARGTRGGRGRDRGARDVRNRSSLPSDPEDSKTRSRRRPPAPETPAVLKPRRIRDPERLEGLSRPRGAARTSGNPRERVEAQETIPGDTWRWVQRVGSVQPRSPFPPTGNASRRLDNHRGAFER